MGAHLKDQKGSCTQERKPWPEWRWFRFLGANI